MNEKMMNEAVDIPAKEYFYKLTVEKRKIADEEGYNQIVKMLVEGMSEAAKDGCISYGKEYQFPSSNCFMMVVKAFEDLGFTTRHPGAPESTCPQQLYIEISWAPN